MNQTNGQEKTVKEEVTTPEAEAVDILAAEDTEAVSGGRGCAPGGPEGC